MALEREYATYLARKPDLAFWEGKYIVIQGDNILSGFWDTWESALHHGYQTLGLGPFMVRQINAVEPVIHV